MGSNVIPSVRGLPFNEEIARELGRIDGRARTSDGKERCTHVQVFCPKCESEEIYADIYRRQQVDLVSIFYIADNLEADTCDALFNEKTRLKQVSKEVKIRCRGCGYSVSSEKFAKEHFAQIKKGKRWGIELEFPKPAPRKPKKLFGLF